MRCRFSKRLSAAFRPAFSPTRPIDMSSAAKIEISTELLRRLHRIHRQRADLTGQIQRGPRQVQAGKMLVGKAESALEEAREKLKAAKMASDEKQLQLKSRELRIEELQVKLNTAASNREFSTLKEQIAADKQANSVLSDEILESLEQLEVLEAAVAQLAEELKQQQDEQQARAAEVQQRSAELQQELTRVEAELTTSEAEIPAAVRSDYDRLTAARGEEALAPVDAQSCGGCYQTLTHNDLDRLQMSYMIRCPNCNAFLYLPEDRSVK
mgnify:CR=1 FL=1